MNLQLYLLAAEYQEAAEKLAELDWDESTLDEILASLSGELMDKAISIAKMIRNLEATAAQIGHAEAQMAKRRHTLEKRAARIRQYLLDTLKYAGIQKITHACFVLAVRENAPRVVIDEATEIPTAFLHPPEPSAPLPDKMRIKQAIQAGVQVPGCHLARHTRLDIQ